MKIKCLFLIITTIISLSFGQDTTLVSGTLLKVNYLTGEQSLLDNTPWYQHTVHYSPAPESNDSKYLASIRIGDSLYLWKEHLQGFYWPGMEHHLVNPETGFAAPVGRTAYTDLISSSFDMMSPWWLPVNNGMAFLCGFNQQLFINQGNISDSAKTIFDYSEWGFYASINTYIIGKHQNNYLIAYHNHNTGDFEYFSANLDDNLKFTIADTLNASFLHANNPEFFTPCKMRNISSSVYLMTNDDYENYIGVVTSDSIKTTDKVINSRIKIYNNYLYYLSNNVLVKQKVDTSLGTLNDPTHISLGLVNPGMISSDFSDNLMFWDSDTIKVFSLPEEAVIYSGYFPYKTEEYLTSEISTWGRQIAFIDNENFYLHKIDFISSKESSTELVTDIALDQNYPNPFNPVTTIRYSLPAEMTSAIKVSLRIYDILGNEIEILVNEKQGTGEYSISWDGSKFASGVYFYTLTTPRQKISKKMLLLK